MKPSSHSLSYGDKIFARIYINGKGIMEFVLDKVTDMSQLIGALRHHVRKYSGLAKIYVRNMTRGWAMERPLMLYPEAYVDAQGVRHIVAAANTRESHRHMQLTFNWRH